MLKLTLLAGGMMIAGAALAQTQPGAATSATESAPPTQAAPAPTVPTAPTGDAMTAQTSPATPAPTAPSDPAVTDDTVEPGTTPSTQPAPTQPEAGGGSQVEQIIAREFGAYDRNKDGRLGQAEFDTWMVALKTASDPATRADAPATKQWLGAAFAQADADKSRDVTQAELTGFLMQGQS